MDPGAGRRWVGGKALLRQLFVHDLSVPAEDWRAWAGTEEFLVPLRARLSGLGFSRSDIEVVTSRALRSSKWRPLAESAFLRVCAVTPWESGFSLENERAGDEGRTRDLLITNQLLYH